MSEGLREHVDAALKMRWELKDDSEKCRKIIDEAEVNCEAKGLQAKGHLLRKAIGPTIVHVDNEGIIDGWSESKGL